MMPLMGSIERILLGNPLGGSYAGSVKSMWEQGSINIDTGEETSSETGVRSGYLDARENAYYTQRTIGWGTFDKIIWYFYTSEKEFLGVKTDTAWTALVLAPVNCVYIRLVISNDATSISPADVPDIALEDRSVWGWNDPNDYGNCLASKVPEITAGHYYYQKNVLRKSLGFQLPSVTILNDSMTVIPKDFTDNTIMFINIVGGENPVDIGDLVFEDRDVWGWDTSSKLYIMSQLLPIEKRILTVEYTGNLRYPQIGLYGEESTLPKTLAVPLENETINERYTDYRVFINISDNPTITPADMVNHGTWTVTFSDPVSDHWQDDGTDIWQQIVLKTAGKSLAITAPESFVGCYINFQMSDGQHHATLPYTIADTTDVEWVQLRIPKASNPLLDLTNVDSYDGQWSWVFGEIVVTEPHWEGENFVFTAADIQVGKAWQKSGNDIVLVDDAGAIALPIITTPVQWWRILINNVSVGRDLNGVEIRKTGAGVTATACDISQGSFYSFILPAAGDQLAIHWTNGAGTTAQQLYDGITITGSEG